VVEVPELDSREAPRARRWDALVLGSGVRALVAAARLAAASHRVLVVEEAARTALPPALREPFFLAGLRDEGVLDACLRLLTVPLIDRRRIEPERLAYQIAADPYRLDVGRPLVTADELVAWGLLPPEPAQTLVRRLLEASEIERKLLLEAPFVRVGRRLAMGRSGPAMGSHKRGLPGDAASASGDLRRILDAQVEALAHLGRTRPSPEAQARLLGLPLAGGAGFAGEPPWLLDLLRKRATAVYGDFRSVSGGFRLVSVAGQPGIQVARTGEIWLGRALVLATQRSALRAVYDRFDLGPAPSLLDSTAPGAYRACLLFRVPVRVLPEGMSARLVLPGDAEGESTVSVTAFPSQTQPNQIELVARARVPGADPDRLPEQLRGLRARIAERLKGLMPFCGDALVSIESELPQWDSDDGWLEDPEPGQGWPSEIDLRLSSRPPVYQLDRASVAGLGLEGDLLLGWRGGDAIAQELS
jgi:hypothetical protein